MKSSKKKVKKFTHLNFVHITEYTMNAEKDREAPAYIQYRTKQSDDFAKKMSSGEYGSLD